MSLPELFIVPHTHWDREWYQSFQDFRRRLVRLVDRLLDSLEGDPELRHFHFDGQTIVLEDYLEIRPENRERLRRLVRAGRIAIGPWYVLPDEFLVSGESLIRNLQIGHQLAAALGEPLAVGYLPDQFGHIAQMPQLLQLFRIDDAVVWRGVGEDVDRTEFLWSAPDGSTVFTVYLPGWGYSNGRQLPVDSGRLSDRLRSLAEEQSAFRRLPVMLVMNGTDHQELQTELPGALRGLDGELRASITSLKSYIAAARAAASELSSDRPLPRHRGELRSPLRAHLLPGVTSMRIRQKQRDFANLALLERYAEPLATWADSLGGRRNLAGFVDWAWKLAIQNHPHDSICGCSIDQVHQDMEYRFDQVESVARSTAHQALRAVAGQVFGTTADDGHLLLAVYNPNHATRTVIHAEVHDRRAAELRLFAVDGAEIALAKDLDTGETLLDVEMPPAAIRPHIVGLYNREMLGYFINDIVLTQVGSRLDARVVVDRVLRGTLDMTAARQRWVDYLDDPSIELVHVHAGTAASAKLTFVADLAGFGLTPFVLRADAANEAPPPGRELRADVNVIENEYFRVSANADGSLTIVDKEADLVFDRCQVFVDEGDRGDEYNFDELIGSAPISAPSNGLEVTAEPIGAVGVRLMVQQEYRLPRRLEDDRETRSSEQVPMVIRSCIALHAGVRRIDFATSFDNQAEDHRLRVHFATPLRATVIECEQAFAVVARPLALPPASEVERPIGTVPQKTFSAIEEGGRGVALFNRGIPEIEAIPTAGGTTLALTLVRSVGWLSRGDLRLRNGHAGPGLPTPGGQSLGTHRFEYALTTYRGGGVDARVANAAHDYAFPPLAAVGDGDARAPVVPFHLDNPNIIVSAVLPGKRSGGWLVRCYNTTRDEQVANIISAPGTSLSIVDLRDQLLRWPIKRRQHRAQVRFAPAAIVNLRIDRQRAAVSESAEPIQLDTAAGVISLRQR